MLPLQKRFSVKLYHAHVMSLNLKLDYHNSADNLRCSHASFLSLNKHCLCLNTHNYVLSLSLNHEYNKHKYTYLMPLRMLYESIAF